MTIPLDAAAHRDHAQAAACRRLWADVAVDLGAMDRMKKVLGARI